MSAILRKRFREQILVMFGREPKKPEAISEPAQQIHLVKRTSNKEKLQAAAAHAEAHMNTSHKWRNRRWAVLALVNLFFVFSYYYDIQTLEGALTASRFIGFHLIDFNAALQVMLAHRNIITNLLAVIVARMGSGALGVTSGRHDGDHGAGECIVGCCQRRGRRPDRAVGLNEVYEGAGADGAQ